MSLLYKQVRYSLCLWKHRNQRFDYLNSSLGLFTEVTNKTHGMAMREDIILSLLSTRLKEIANEFDVFIMSATQTNAKLFVLAITPYPFINGVIICSKIR